MTAVNAAGTLVAALSREALRRLAPGVADDDRVHTLADTFALDLCGLLNRLRADELRALAAALKLSDGGDVLALRGRLWHWGAEHEAGGPALVGTPLQPRPVA